MWPFPMESAHPMLVHFPIALLSVASLLDIAALALKRPEIHGVALWNLVLGTAAAAAAVASGLHAESVAKHSFEIWRVMERHQQLGITTLVVSAVSLAWRLARRARLSPRERLATTGLGLLALISLTLGAHLGGRLVYEFGVGGSFGQKSLPTSSNRPLNQEK